MALSRQTVVSQLCVVFPDHSVYSVHKLRSSLAHGVYSVHNLCCNGDSNRRRLPTALKVEICTKITCKETCGYFINNLEDHNIFATVERVKSALLLLSAPSWLEVFGLARACRQRWRPSDGQQQRRDSFSEKQLASRAKYENKRRDVSDGVTLGEMVGESGGKHSTMAAFLVMVAMMVATSKAAFIDKRPKMPR